MPTIVHVATIVEGSGNNSRRQWQPGAGNKWQLCNQILPNSSLLSPSWFGSIQFRQIWHQHNRLKANKEDKQSLITNSSKKCEMIQILKFSGESGCSSPSASLFSSFLEATSSVCVTEGMFTRPNFKVTKVLLKSFD